MDFLCFHIFIAANSCPSPLLTAATDLRVNHLQVVQVKAITFGDLQSMDKKYVPINFPGIIEKKGRCMKCPNTGYLYTEGNLVMEGNKNYEADCLRCEPTCWPGGPESPWFP